MTRARRRWERPRVSSAPIPVIELLLAESYKKKAEQWAEAAARLRQEPSATR